MTHRKMTTDESPRFRQETAEKLPWLQEWRFAMPASSAKVTRKFVTAVQMLPIMIPVISSAAMERTRPANSSTKPVTIREPRKEAAIMVQ